MTASTSIVTLSRVMTGCGSICVICSRRSIVARTESKNGRMTFSPASAFLWNFPSRSMSFTCFCGTTWTDFRRITSAKKTRRPRTNGAGDSMEPPLFPVGRRDEEDDSVGAVDADLGARVDRRGAPRGPVLARDVHTARAADGVDRLRDVRELAGERFGARGHSGASEA